MPYLYNRRKVLAGVSALGAAGLISRPAQAEPPPETSTVRLAGYFIEGCDAALYFAEDMLRAEGFTDVQRVTIEAGVDPAIYLARGELDFDWNYGATFLASIEAGAPIKVLTGLHSGCLEVIANDSVNSIADLRGKKVGIYTLTSSPHILLMLMATFVGLDPGKDIEWVPNQDTTPIELFAQGKIDAFLGTPPEPQEMRARKLGHTILATAVDRPWSQYYCCMLAGTADYVSNYPVATKRVMRALLKAVDLCQADAPAAARRMVEGGYTKRYDLALQALNDARYDRWREFDPEDTLRFYALRMQETGLIKSSPNELIAKGADWRFLNELKRELKT